MKRNVLVEQAMTDEMLFKVKEEMDRAEARKLQPCFVRSFFLEAFRSVGGSIREPRGEKSGGRYEIRHVPSALLETAREQSPRPLPVAPKYGRICFEKEQIHPILSEPKAAFIHPGHPLMQALLRYVLNENRSYLKPGSILIDRNDDGITPSILFLIDHSIRESGEGDLLVSRRLQFVRRLPDGTQLNAGWAPHLDLDLPTDDERKLAEEVRKASWITPNLESDAIAYATVHMAQEHYAEVSRRRKEQVSRTRALVNERLTVAINQCQGEAIQLEEDIKAGLKPSKKPEDSWNRAEDLTRRLKKRLEELARQETIFPNTPTVMGGILVIPQGYLNQRTGEGTFSADSEARRRIETLAMNAVIETEKRFGHDVTDVSKENCGWDVTARKPFHEGEPIPEARHLEVKGKVKGAESLFVTKNEIITGLNQGDKYILAIVLVDGDKTEGPYYIPRPFLREPEIGTVRLELDMKVLLGRAVAPEATL